MAAKRHRGAGFTLVELLVTIAIIAILAGISLVALHAAQESARDAATRATISKINFYVMQLYQSYGTRRIDIIPPPVGPDAAKIRLDCLRDLMRMEMPDRWTDLDRTPQLDPKTPANNRGVPFRFTYGAVTYYVRPPVTWRAYLRRYQHCQDAVNDKYGGGPADGEGPERLARHESAECLYLVVMTNFPEASQHFLDNEIADTDDDGLREFIDGWGNPIRFLRWAPGFTDTDFQPRVDPPDNAQARQIACNTDPDPLNPRRIATAYAPLPGWRLVPLIYSAGPDGIYDIAATPNADPAFPNTSYSYTGDPYVVLFDTNNVAYMLGTPRDRYNRSVTATGPANGRLDHYDNIHNHRLEVSEVR